VGTNSDYTIPFMLLPRRSIEFCCSLFALCSLQF
jgi:hypothetical protein